MRRTTEQAARKVLVTFSWCGHDAMVEQTTTPTKCPKGCDANGGWDPLVARRHSMLGRHSL